jgi:N-acetylglucosamine-6-phosphate deacetylase
MPFALRPGSDGGHEGDGRPRGRAVLGRLVLEDRIVPGRIEFVGQHIDAVLADGRADSGPYLCPGFVDVHVHGWGGHDAMGGEAELDGMAEALLRRGVTSFLPTAETASIEALAAFAERVRHWSPTVGDDRSEPLGFNLEGPFISPQRRGAQNPAFIRAPAEVGRDSLEELLDGLKIWTIAPELEGAADLIRWLATTGVAVSLGHSNATAEEAAAGYRAGARSTTHLFNAMSGFDHHAPGLAAAALADDAAYAELIADGLHVDRWLWPTIVRGKPADRLILVSDAIAAAGMEDGPTIIGGLEAEVRDGECRMVADGRLAGSLIALDSAVRNLVQSGVALPVAVRAASLTPLQLIGIHDRGRIAPGQLADLVELDERLVVQRVMKRGRWQTASGGLANLSRRPSSSRRQFARAVGRRSGR